MNTIGIIVAMSEELQLLRKKMDQVTEVKTGGCIYYQGVIGTHKIVLVCCGVGKVNAAVCATILCTQFHVAYVINSGVAGGAAKDIKPFDIVLSSEFVAHDVNPRISETYFPNLWIYPSDKNLLKTAVEACRHLHIDRSFIGRIATGDIYVESDTVKEDIIQRTHPLCVEMEGQAIAQVCHIFNCPFLAIRCISDSADDNSNLDFAAFVQEASDHSASIVLDMIDQM